MNKLLLTLFGAKEGEITTTPLFWDCECKENFIHPNTDFMCLECMCVQDEQPESRVEEVIRYINKLNEGDK